MLDGNRGGGDVSQVVRAAKEAWKGFESIVKQA